MRFIEKGAEPPLLRRWRLANRSTPHILRYMNMPGDALAEVRRCLFKEQGFLCAYTMLRISDESRGHVEHVLARSRANDREIDYANIVYCHPGDGAKRCKFGAHAKDDASVSRDIFISPLESECEARFIYAPSGDIKPRKSNDPIAIRTIETLNLNETELKVARRAAIRDLPIFKRSANRLSAAQARKEAKHTKMRDDLGQLRPFAAALHQFMADYARKRATQERARRQSSTAEGKR